MLKQEVLKKSHFTVSWCWWLIRSNSCNSSRRMKARCPLHFLVGYSWRASAHQGRISYCQTSLAVRKTQLQKLLTSDPSFVILHSIWLLIRKLHLHFELSLSTLHQLVHFLRSHEFSLHCLGIIMHSVFQSSCLVPFADSCTHYSVLCSLWSCSVEEHGSGVTPF